MNDLLNSNVSDSLKTKYPVMLVHGIGYTDDDHKRYWGRIPAFLESKGVELYFGNQDPFGTVTENAAQLRDNVIKVMDKAGCDKLNLIAHSKGGLESRYMISKLGMEDRIASLTTLATPHRGIAAMDKMKEKNLITYRALLRVFNILLVASGGHINRDYTPFEHLTSDYMKVFNELVCDSEKVYYQSYAFDMKNTASYPDLAPFYKIIKETEGQNDGLVSVKSAEWTNFMGVYTGPGNIGVAHSQVVDSKMRPITDAKTGGGLVDILDLYYDIIDRLKYMGY